LAALGGASLGALILWWRASNRRRVWRVRRRALAELRRIGSSPQDLRAGSIQRLMRRYALAVFDAEAVVRLSGEAWMRFVEEHGGGFSAAEGREFLRAAFGHDIANSRDWVPAAEAFIRRAPRSTRRRKRA
jgi:hypothetical protein